MKKHIIILAILGLFFSINTRGQSYSPFGAGNRANKKVELVRNIDFTVGYIMKSEINALKSTASINNLILKRFGGYISFEKGLDSDYFYNTLGGTLTAFPFLSFWAGVDVFSKHGLFKDGLKTRKEIGMSIVPYKRVVLQFGYSNTSGPSISAGYQFPFPGR